MILADTAEIASVRLVGGASRGGVLAVVSVLEAVSKFVELTEADCLTELEL